MTATHTTRCYRTKVESPGKRLCLCIKTGFIVAALTSLLFLYFSGLLLEQLTDASPRKVMKGPQKINEDPKSTKVMVGTKKATEKNPTIHNKTQKVKVSSKQVTDKYQKQNVETKTLKKSPKKIATDSKNKHEEDKKLLVVKDEAVNALQVLSVKLAKVRITVIKQEAVSLINDGIQLLDNILKQVLGDKYQVKSKQTSKNTHLLYSPSRKREQLDVCPEMNLGKKHDRVFHETNRPTSKCSNAPPFSSTLSILLNGLEYENSGKIRQIIEDIPQSYSNLTIHLALIEPIKLNSKLSVTVQQHVLPKNVNSGQLWNYLVNNATTKYILVAPRLNRFLWYARLERLVRVISELSIDAVGGATVTPDGHWTMGCFQTTLKNYTLVYEDGYYLSRSSCAYCNHLVSPFVVKRKTLKSLMFDKSLTGDISIYDWFLRLRKKSGTVMACPDSMFYQQYDMTVSKDKQKFLPLVQKYKLNRIKFANGLFHSFSCKESKTNCRWVYGTIMPICCLQSLSQGIARVMDMCEDAGFYCRTICGTTLGAEKMNGILPWERDADIWHIPRNDSSIWELRDKFKKRYDYELKLANPDDCKKFDPANKDCPDYDLYIPGWRIAILPKPELVEEFMFYKQYNLSSTKLAVDGKWVTASRSPGLEMRNLYGDDNLKHAEHYIDLGKGVNDQYKPGVFKRSCPEPGQHFCLQNYIPDGNMQFRDPLL